jgi:hypothetical protein
MTFLPSLDARGGVFSMPGHGAHSAGNEGLTDHSSRDLYGIVARLPKCLALGICRKMPVRIQRVCR